MRPFADSSSKLCNNSLVCNQILSPSSMGTNQTTIGYTAIKTGPKPRIARGYIDTHAQELVKIGITVNN